MDIVSLNYLDFLNGQNQNLKRSYLVASFLISDIQKVSGRSHSFLGFTKNSSEF